MEAESPMAGQKPRSLSMGPRKLAPMQSTKERIDTNEKAMLTMILALEILTFLLFFTGMLWGDDVYRELSEHTGMWKGVFGLGVFIFCILYALDFTMWQGDLLINVRRVGIAVIAACLIIGCLLSTKDYPYAPPALFCMLAPASFWFIKRRMFNHLTTHAFVGGLALPCVICGVSVLFAWFLWVLIGDRMWSPKIRNEYKAKMECNVDEVYCLEAYLQWFLPFMVGVGTLFFALLFHLLGKSLRTEGSGHARTLSVARLFITLFVTIAAAVWIGAEIAAAEIGLSKVIEMIAGVSLIVVGAVCMHTVGWENVKQAVLEVPILAKIAAALRSDVAKALGVFACGVPYMMFLMLAMLNQFVRKHTTFGYTIQDDDERKALFTKVVSGQLNILRSWNWSRILTWVHYWGIIYVTLIVGISKVVTVFLSWLNYDVLGTDQFSIVDVFIIFWFIGLTMFLLPPVPGVPVYLTGGVILVAKAWKGFCDESSGETCDGDKDGLDFAPCVMVASVWCFTIKLAAIVIQQKGFGEMLGNRVGIRKMVGVNSVSIRAIKTILEKPGLSVPKCAILVGGPDWPTSVLTGILKLNVFQMLLGSLPVFVLVTATTVAGSFQLRIPKEDPNAISEETDAWESLASVVLAIAACVQGAGLILAAHYIEKVASENLAALEAMPDDEEVKELELKEAASVAAFAYATKWHAPHFPKACKWILASSAVIMAISVYLLQFMADDCFKEFEVIDTIDDKLDGNVFNVVLSLGWVSMGMFAISWFIMWCFQKWASNRAKKPEFQVDPELYPASGEGNSVVVVASAANAVAGVAGLAQP